MMILNTKEKRYKKLYNDIDDDYYKPIVTEAFDNSYVEY